MKKKSIATAYDDATTRNIERKQDEEIIHTIPIDEISEQGEKRRVAAEHAEYGKTTFAEYLHAKLFMFANGFVGMFFKKKDADEIIFRTLAEDAEEVYGREEFSDDPVPEDLGDADKYYACGNSFAKGGTADIFMAEDKQLGRIVALKKLKEKFINDKKSQTDFETEARITAQLEHPSIIPVYRLCGKNPMDMRIVMRLIRGQTLRRYLRLTASHYETRGVLMFDEERSISQRLDIFLNICAGLEYAHSRGIIHNDLKPENIMIGFYHEAYILDWGCARKFTPIGKDDPDTLSGIPINGTPSFISPEAAHGFVLDQRADVFSMGAILFELVTLRRAFTGNGTHDILNNICLGRMSKVRHLCNVPIASDLKNIIVKATAPDRNMRYRSITELADDIRAFRRGRNVSATHYNIFELLFRWLGEHKSVLLVLVLSFIMVGVSLIAYSALKRINDAEDAKIRTEFVNTSYSQAISIGNRINDFLMSMEFSVKSLADDTEFMMKHLEIKENRPGRTMQWKAFTDELDLPPGALYSRQHKTYVDFTEACWIAAPGTPAAEIQKYCLGMRPLSMRFRNILLANRYDDISIFGRAALEPENMSKFSYSIHWIYVSFENGIQICYPSNGQYNEDYDPRRRAWYLNAVKNPASVVWNGPYPDVASDTLPVFTVSKTVTDSDVEGRIFGVASIDVTSAELARIVHEIDKSELKSHRKRLLTADGGVLMDSADKKLKMKEDADGRLVLEPFPYRELFEEMKRLKYGIISREERGEDIIYIFLRIPQIDCYYVVRHVYSRGASPEEILDDLEPHKPDILDKFLK